MTPKETATAVNEAFENVKQKGLFVKGFCNSIDDDFATKFIAAYQPMLKKKLEDELKAVQAKLDALK